MALKINFYLLWQCRPGSSWPQSSPSFSADPESARGWRMARQFCSSCCSNLRYKKCLGAVITDIYVCRAMRSKVCLFQTVTMLEIRIVTCLCLIWCYSKMVALLFCCLGFCYEIICRSLVREVNGTILKIAAGVSTKLYKLTNLPSIMLLVRGLLFTVSSCLVQVAWGKRGGRSMTVPSAFIVPMYVLRFYNYSCSKNLLSDCKGAFGDLDQNFAKAAKKKFNVFLGFL